MIAPIIGPAPVHRSGADLARNRGVLEHFKGLSGAPYGGAELQVRGRADGLFEVGAVQPAQYTPLSVRPYTAACAAFRYARTWDDWDAMKDADMRRER